MPTTPMSETELIKMCKVEISHFERNDIRCKHYTDLLKRFEQISKENDSIKHLKAVQDICLKELVYPLSSGIKSRGAAMIIQDYINEHLT